MGEHTKLFCESRTRKTDTVGWAHFWSTVVHTDFALGGPYIQINKKQKRCAPPSFGWDPFCEKDATPNFF